MKSNLIAVGGRYNAKVGGVMCQVELKEINTLKSVGKRSVTRYVCKNLRTGRTVIFKSTAKFLSPISTSGPASQKQSVRGPIVADPELPVEEDRIEQARGGQHESPKTTDCAPLPPITPKPLSGLQMKIRSLTTNRPPHMVIEARAGTGKTTTLVEGLKVVLGMGSKLTPSTQQAMVWDAMALSKNLSPRDICFVAFNRSIVGELQRRIPEGTQAKTMHGLGLQAIRGAFKLRGAEGGVQQWRVRNIVGEILGVDMREWQRQNPGMIQSIEELVGMCKANLVGFHPEVMSEYGHDAFLTTIGDEDLDRLADYFETELEIRGVCRRTEIYDLVRKVLVRSCQVDVDGCVDYNDMIWLPVVLSLSMRRYAILLVDEAQDLNRCQQELAKLAGDRLIFCGDPKQAIYGFAGADTESLRRLEDDLGRTPQGCIHLPLTVTRRCGKAIVAEAKKLVPDFDAHETNCAGEILNASFDDGAQSYRRIVQNDDMVLCRVNAPLVSECFRFIKQGRKANIQGRDVGKGLIRLIEKLCGSTPPMEVDISTIVTAMDTWLEQEMKKEQAKKFPSEAKLIALQDRHDCLSCFTDGANNATQMIEKIQQIFTDDKQTRGIRLSSIHKAKGLEAHRVFLLMPKSGGVPHPMAKADWQREQEWNLKYVAITRAIETLTYVIEE